MTAQDNSSQNAELAEGLITPSDFKPASGKPRGPRLRLNPLSISLLVLLLICLSAALYLFTAQSVSFGTEPPQPSVGVGGNVSLGLGDQYLMQPGEFIAKAKAKGYHPLEQSFTVNNEVQNQSVKLKLSKLPGHLTVNTKPMIEAEVFLDEKPIGKTNSKISNLQHGDYQLLIKSERYQDVTQALTITGLDQHQEVPVELTPDWASLNFSTKPPEATVTVDGEVVGRTPIKTEILSGTHLVEIKLPGYKVWQDDITVVALEDQEIPEITLVQADGLVMLKSTPSGASVTLNGQYRGQTPVELALAPDKSYQLTLFKDGFDAAQRKITVQSGEDQHINVRLKAQLGAIKIVARPKEALLYVEGRLLGRANQTIELPARQHQITLKADGYVDSHHTVRPRPSSQQQLRVAMKTVDQAKWENIKTIITTSAGQQLKLFKPKDTFTMGASRREQGRRANEVIRKVKLTRPFYLGLHEVTNSQFRKFVRQHSSNHVKGNSLNGDKAPVVNLSWTQAALYCNWLSQQENLPEFYVVEEQAITGFNLQSTGYRLPTEAEWTWAARYHNKSMLKYPWGEQLPPAGKAGNYADISAARLVGHIQGKYNDGYPVTAPIGSFPANSRGLYDMGGNAAEWVNDYYEIKTGLSLKVDENPIGPEAGDYNVIRGSSWAHGTVTELRLSFRDYSNKKRNDVGFRLARFVE